MSVHLCTCMYVHAYWYIRAQVEASLTELPSTSSHIRCLQCFDAVGWAAGRASGL